MIGLDTNVIARYVMRDDPDQTALADQLVSSLTAQNPGYLSLIVLVELWWVLGRSYHRSVAERRSLYAEFLRIDELKIEDAPTVKKALSHVDAGADFADAIIYHRARAAGCASIVTFDETAAKRLGMTALTP